MPPKSTYFFPKVLTGLLFNPLAESAVPMRATAKQQGNFRHEVKVRAHTLTADEPEDSGGDDIGPSPEELLAASLASCTAITMEMYAKRKGWDMAGLEVDCEYTPAERGCPTKFNSC